MAQAQSLWVGPWVCPGGCVEVACLPWSADTLSALTSSVGGGGVGICPYSDSTLLAGTHAYNPSYVGGWHEKDGGSNNLGKKVGKTLSHQKRLG
jgi:hypothetical protein